MNLKYTIKLIQSGFELLIVWKEKGKVKFINLWWFSSRNKSMEILLKEALETLDKNNLPFTLINTWDRPINKYFKANVLSFSTANWFYDKIIPDFIYESRKECKIPSYNQIVNEISNAWKEEWQIDKIWWIWSFNSHPSRKVLAELGEKYPEDLDIKDSTQKGTKRMTMEELVQTYKYLIDVEWAGYSWRLKLLFFSWRPVFVQERLRKDFALLKAEPNKHYIPIKNDFSDLIEKIKELKSNKKFWEEIWKNGKIFAMENLSKDSAIIYIQETFKNIEEDPLSILKFFILASIKIFKRLWNWIKLFLLKKL